MFVGNDATLGGIATFHSSNWAVNSGIIGFANAGLHTPNCQGGLPGGLDNANSIEEVASTIEIVPSRAQWNDLRYSFLGFGAAVQALGGPASLNDTGWCARSGMKADGSGAVAACPASGNGPIHVVNKTANFVWADSHAKAKAPAATLRLSDQVNDDWGTKYMLAGDGTNPHPGNVTYADKQTIAANLFPEYK